MASYRPLCRGDRANPPRSIPCPCRHSGEALKDWPDLIYSSTYVSEGSKIAAELANRQASSITVCHGFCCRGCQHGLRSAESPPACAGKRLRRNRSRPDHPPEVDSRCADAARRALSRLVPAAGGRARNPEWLPELAGTGALCHPPPQRPDRGTRPGVPRPVRQASASRSSHCPIRGKIHAGVGTHHPLLLQPRPRADGLLELLADLAAGGQSLTGGQHSGHVGCRNLHDPGARADHARPQ
jgi:hypothetical protein